MYIKDIVAGVNSKLAGEMLTYNELKQFLDHTVDDINNQLNSAYPVFSELEGGVSEYNVFPDKYIRSVVIPGAAWYYYVMDEEGTPTAQQYSMDYSRGLFIMQRDMLYNIPEQYQADSEQGTVAFGLDADKGIEVDFGVGEW